VGCFGGHGLPNSLESLKRFLVKAAAENPLGTVRSAIAEWPESFKAGLEAEGVHIEGHHCKWNLKLSQMNYLA